MVKDFDRGPNWDPLIIHGKADSQWPPWWLLLSARVWGHSVACEGSWWIWSFVVSSLCSPFPVPAQKPPLLRVLPLPASGRTPTTSLCQVELLIYIYLTIGKIFFSPYKVQPATVNFWVCLVTFSKSSEKWEVGAGGGRCFPCEIPLFWPPEFPEIFIYLHVRKSQLFILFIIGCACKWRRLQLKWDFFPHSRRLPLTLVTAWKHFLPTWDCVRHIRLGLRRRLCGLSHT